MYDTLCQESFSRHHDEFSFLFENSECIDVFAFSAMRGFLEENCLPMDNFNGFYTTQCDKRCGGVLLCFKKCFKSFEMTNLSGAYDSFELSTIQFYARDNLPICIL